MNIKQRLANVSFDALVLFAERRIIIMKIIYYEFKMDFLRSIRYRMAIISDIVVFTFLLCFFYVSDTGASFSETYAVNDYKTLLLLGYIAWSFSVAAISNISSQLTGELQRGTLFFKFNCKLPLQILYIGDLISAIFIQTFVILIYSLITYIIFGVHYYFNIYILIALLICIIGMYGIGLIIAGLSLYYKKVGSIIFLVQICLLFITDTIPTTPIITNISQIIPLTSCNIVIRNIFLKNNYTHAFLYLLILSSFWFILGYFIFDIFVHLSKKRGNLLLY